MKFTIKKIASAFRAAFLADRAPRRSAAQKARLRLEQFESREVPTRLFWIGVAGTDATNPANWYDPKDDVTGILPGAEDLVIFGYYSDNAQYPSAATTPCIGLAGSFGDVQIRNTYSGTVTFGGAVTMEALTLEGGAISQPTSGTDLTITTVFIWTGGTLNSSTNLSTVHISGATATIEPLAYGSITTGSTLSFEAGSQAAVEAGTINLLNSATINVDLLSSVFVDTTMADVNFTAPQVAAPPAGKIDGTWVVDGGKNSTLPIGLQVTGTLKVQGKSKLDINSGAAISVETANNKGTIVIQNDSALKVSNGLKIAAGGALQTLALNLANVTDQRNKPAIIDGNFYMADGTVTLGMGGATHIWSNLKVTGLGEWTGGTINITIDRAANNNKFDSLTFGGEFLCQVTLQMGQPVPNSPAFAITPDGGLAPVGNQVWKPILTAAAGISNVGPLPTVSSSAGAGFAVAPEAKVNNQTLAWDIQN